MYYIKKPIPIEGISYAELEAICLGRASFYYKAHIIDRGNDCFWIPNASGKMKMTKNDVLMCGVKGELYPCSIEILKDSYDVYEPETQGTSGVSGYHGINE